MSVETWTYLLVGLSFALYFYIGYTARVRDTKGFYVAGRRRSPRRSPQAARPDPRHRTPSGRVRAKCSQYKSKARNSAQR